MGKKNLIVFAVIVVLVIATILALNLFVYPMKGHPLVGMWTTISDEVQHIGTMAIHPFPVDMLVFRDRGDGGLVNAEAPSMHRHRFSWTEERWRRVPEPGVIAFTYRPGEGDYVRFFYYYSIEMDLLTLRPVRGEGEPVVFRR